MHRPLVLLFAGLLLGACGVLAPRGDAGFAELGSPGVLDTNRVLAISIGPAILRFAARHTKGDPETQALLRALDGVRVRIYEITGDRQRVGRRLQRMNLDLQQGGWAPVAVLEEDGEQVHMLVKVGRDRILGLVVMAAEESRELVMVNVMGDLRPEMFSDAMTALDVDAPDVVLASTD